MARFLSSLILLALIVGGTLAVWPQLAGLELREPFVQLVALRGAAAAAALALALVLLLLALLARPLRGFLGGACVILVLFAGANAGILASRGIANEALRAPVAGELTVLSWNTQGDAVPAERVAEQALRAGAQIVVLPETTAGLADGVARAMSAAGVPVRAHTVATDEVYRARSTSVLLAAELGEYRLDEAAGAAGVLPSVVLRPAAGGDAPTIIGAHAVAPVSGEMAGWREHLRWLRASCAAGNTIIAGDMNATPDHLGGLNGCSIAAVTAGNAGVGSWPTALPALLGSPIDQVFSTAEWPASGFAVVTDADDAGSDHRPVVARLRPALG